MKGLKEINISFFLITDRDYILGFCMTGPILDCNLISIMIQNMLLIKQTTLPVLIFPVESIQLQIGTGERSIIIKILISVEIEWVNL